MPGGYGALRGSVPKLGLVGEMGGLRFFWELCFFEGFLWQFVQDVAMLGEGVRWKKPFMKSVRR